MKNLFLSLLIVLLFSSCRFVKKEECSYVLYYDNTLQICEEHVFHNCADTLNYEFNSYYPNGQIKERGMIVDAKRDGTWERWYADGIFRGEIEYVTGEEDRFNGNREIPIIVFETDSLIVGKRTHIKLIHAYPSDGLSCNDVVMGLGDKSYYDFAVIPSGADSVRFYYFCIWCPPAETDTVTIFKSDTDSLLKYGYIEEDFGEQESKTVVFNRVKTLELGAFPVYDK